MLCPIYNFIHFSRRCICFDDTSNQERQKAYSHFLLFWPCTYCFLLSIYRGAESAYRTEQGIPFYISAITLLLSSKIINSNGKKALKIIASLSLVIILTVQICSSNYWYHVNVLRDKEEKQVVCNIAKGLEKYDKNKPVIFIGYYQLSNNIKDKYAVKKTVWQAE